MAERFWLQAKSDLANARANVRPDGYYVAAYLAHQAAEKALKAVHWHLLHEEPPWTHDLAAILERLRMALAELPATVDEALNSLNPMLERSRYPSTRLDAPIPADLFVELDSQQAILAGEEVMAWAQRQLERPPGRPENKSS